MVIILVRVALDHLQRLMAANNGDAGKVYPLLYKMRDVGMTEGVSNYSFGIQTCRFHDPRKRFFNIHTVTTFTVFRGEKPTLFDA